jgi:hypothetical protein
MLRFLGVVSVAALTAVAAGSVSAQSNAELIAQAVMPLPDDLKEGATVFRYDSDSGERIVIRQGSNQVECQPRDEEGFTRCGPVAEGPRRDLSSKLSAQGLEGEALQAALADAEAKGQIKPRTFGALNYRLYDKDDRIQLLWVVSVPNATAAELGYPTGGQRNNALAGKGTPWMMLDGTPGAHLMIPINGTPLSNAGH